MLISQVIRMNRKVFGIFILIQWLCLIQPKEALFVNKKSLSENIQSGLIFAGKMFGIDHAPEIADLVARTFSQNSKQSKYEKRQDGINNPIDYGNQNTLMISNILQIIGLDSAKIGALAVNGIIFIAQLVRNSVTVVKSYVHQSLADWSLIGDFILHRLHDSLKPNNTNIGRSLVSSFTEKIDSKLSDPPSPSKRSSSSGTPLDWILESKSPVLINMIQELRNKSLPQRLVEMLEVMDDDNGDADCIKLLMCKTSPLIWGMQRACNDSIDGNEQNDDIDESQSTGMNSFFKYLPEMQEFSYNGDACESRYNGCKVLSDE